MGDLFMFSDVVLYWGSSYNYQMLVLDWVEL